MSPAFSLGGLGLALLLLAATTRGWGWLLLWPALNFLALAAAYVARRPDVFGKRPDGRLGPAPRIFFLPYLAFSLAVWHLACRLSRESVCDRVNDTLSIGRRLLPGEQKEEFANYIDLTAEFDEPAAIRALAAYRAFPILDASTPDRAALTAFLQSLRPGRTFIHCAQGHGRTGLVAAALLLHRGEARDVAEAVAQLQRVRPALRLSAAQRQWLEDGYDGSTAAHSRA